VRVGIHSWRARHAFGAVGGAVLVAAACPRPARAVEPELHGEVGVAHAIGNFQQREYGFGAAAGVAGELTLGKVVGVQAELSFLGLPDGAPPSNPAFADHGAAFELGASGGVRFHPFGRQRVAGLWLDGNAGLAFTGGLARATVDTHIGYDLRVGRGRFDVGPFVGYTHVFQPTDTVRPDDAHIVSVGVHLALGARKPATPRGDRDGDTILDDEDACPDVAGVRTDDPRTNGCPRPDRDGDTIFDDEDACPDVPGVRTDDPKTNGCPRSDRDSDTVFDDEDACPDVPGVRTADPKTNGCPRGDRDNDLVFDDEDACPDVPGVQTGDPKTNGCPPAGDDVRMEGDKIVLDDILHFDTDSAHIGHADWPICGKVASFLQANPDVLEIDIEGHADETGTSQHNLGLSRERADAVKRLLVRYKVDPARVTTHAYGETRPKVPGHAEQQLRQNRRVEFTVTRSRPRQPELKTAQPSAVPAMTPLTPEAPPPPLANAGETR